jgi:hypothetical protein
MVFFSPRKSLDHGSCQTTLALVQPGDAVFDQPAPLAHAGTVGRAALGQLSVAAAAQKSGKLNVDNPKKCTFHSSMLAPGARGAGGDAGCGGKLAGTGRRSD